MNFRSATVMALLAAGCGSHATMPTAPPPTITALQVVADQKPFDVGSDYRLRAVATMTDGATLNLSSDLKWSTSKTAVLDITPEGVVTAVSAGEAIVTLRWNAFTASTTLRSQQTRSGVFVRGRVTDHVTGAGVASQKVWIADTTTITDVSGSYSAWLPQGGLIYLDLAPSNSPGYSNFFAASGFRGDLLRDSMMCSARYGRVVDYDTGAPLAGVAIREAWAGGKTVPGTSSDGTYRFDICPGIEIGNTAWVQFDLDGYTGYHLGVGRGRMDVRRFDVQLRRTASPVQR